MSNLEKSKMAGINQDMVKHGPKTLGEGEHQVGWEKQRGESFFNDRVRRE